VPGQAETDVGVLLDDVAEVYSHFVAFHSDFFNAERDLVTLWTAHTYVFEAAETTPYLLVTSPTSEAGKSRLIDVAQHLVRGAEVVNDPSAASLYRLIDSECPSLFIDEVDVLVTSKPLRAVLNAGYRIGGHVTRAERQPGGNYVARRYSVFCPKCFAGISGQRLPLAGATLSRCIVIPMRRRGPDEEIERFTHREARVWSLPLKERLSAFGHAQTATLQQLVVPHVPEGLSDRQAEALEPLFTIADLAGRDWPKRAREAALALTRTTDERPDEAVMLLCDLKRVWEQIETQREHTAVLAESVSSLDDREFPDQITAQELSTWLRRFGIRPEGKPFRLHGKVGRGYRHASFADAFQRYCGA